MSQEEGIKRDQERPGYGDFISKDASQKPEYNQQ